MVRVNINKKSVPIEVDTGASVTILNEETHISGEAKLNFLQQEAAYLHRGTNSSSREGPGWSKLQKSGCRTASTSSQKGWSLFIRLRLAEAN